MRKIYSLASAVLVMLAFYGCGDTVASPTATPISSSMETTATASPGGATSAPAGPTATTGAASTNAPSGSMTAASTAAPSGTTMAATPAGNATPGAGAPTASTTASGPWVPPTALAGTPIPGAVATLTAAPQLKTGTVQFTNNKGETVTMTVEIADTEASRELGLMFRSSLPQEGGMLFNFGSDTTGTFWMANTILPLTIAFITADGKIIHIQDMRPLNKGSVGAPGPYRYAIEANQGYFRAHGVHPGQQAVLP